MLHKIYFLRCNQARAGLVVDFMVVFCYYGPEGMLRMIEIHRGIRELGLAYGQPTFGDRGALQIPD